MKPCPAPSTAVPVAMAAISARSCPEVKAVPRPVSTTAPTASSASAARRAAVTSWYIAVSKALRTSGRLKAIDADAGCSLLDLDPAVTAWSAVQASAAGRLAAARRRMTVSAAPLTPVEMGQPT